MCDDEYDDYSKELNQYRRSKENRGRGEWDNELCWDGPCFLLSHTFYRKREIRNKGTCFRFKSRTWSWPQRKRK